MQIYRLGVSEAERFLLDELPALSRYVLGAEQQRCRQHQLLRPEKNSKKFKFFEFIIKCGIEMRESSKCCGEK